MQEIFNQHEENFLAIQSPLASTISYLFCVMSADFDMLM